MKMIMRLILCRFAYAVRLLKCFRNSIFLRREKVFHTMRLVGQKRVIKQFTRLLYPSVGMLMVVPFFVQHRSTFERSSVHFSSWNATRIFFLKGRVLSVCSAEFLCVYDSSFLSSPVHAILGFSARCLVHQACVRHSSNAYQYLLS